MLIFFGLCGLVGAGQLSLGYIASLHFPDGSPCYWGQDASRAVQMALDEVNSAGYLGDVQLVLAENAIIDAQGVTTGVADKLETLITQFSPIAILGADWSDVALVASQVASHHAIPLISSGATSNNLESPADHPFFLRICLNDATASAALAELATTFRWQSAAVISTTDSMGTAGSRAIIDHLNQLRVPVLGTTSFDRGSPPQVVEELLRQFRDEFGSKLSAIFIAGTAPETMSVLSAAHNLGMGWGAYHFVGIEELTMQADPDVLDSAIGYLTYINAKPDQCAESASFEEEFTSRFGHAPNAWGVYGYDSVWTLAHGVRQILDKGQSPSNGTALMLALRKVQFFGATGQISFRANSNDRQFVRISIKNLQSFSRSLSRATEEDFVEVGQAVPDEAGRLRLRMYLGETVFCNRSSPQCFVRGTGHDCDAQRLNHVCVPRWWLLAGAAAITLTLFSLMCFSICNPRSSEPNAFRRRWFGAGAAYYL